MNEQEMRIMVTVMYFSTICFIIELAMTLTNMWKFLFKQDKYKTWPLLMFYILTICFADNVADLINESRKGEDEPAVRAGYGVPDALLLILFEIVAIRSEKFQFCLSSDEC